MGSDISFSFLLAHSLSSHSLSHSIALSHLPSYLLTHSLTPSQFPESIRDLEPITQLYVSIDASTRDSLKAIDRPLFKVHTQNIVQVTVPCYNTFILSLSIPVFVTVSCTHTITHRNPFLPFLVPTIDKSCPYLPSLSSPYFFKPFLTAFPPHSPFSPSPSPNLSLS